MFFKQKGLHLLPVYFVLFGIIGVRGASFEPETIVQFVLKYVQGYLASVKSGLMPYLLHIHYITLTVHILYTDESWAP